MFHERKRGTSLIRLLTFLVLILFLTEGFTFQAANANPVKNGVDIPTSYAVTFTETGLPIGTAWTVRVITNNSASTSYSSDNNTLKFYEANGSYNYVVNSSVSYVTPEASGIINVSGAAEYFKVNFERTAVSEQYQPYILMNVSQSKTFNLNPEAGPSALSFGVMNTTMTFQVFSGGELIYENNITGPPTNFNLTTATNGYGYTNFQSNGNLVLYVTDEGPGSGFFSFDLWNYYISNYTASLITLPPHLQDVLGTGSLNRTRGAFEAVNNTGMSFTLVAPYYPEPVPLAIFVFDGYWNPLTGNYWMAQVGFNNWATYMYDVSYAGWGVFSNYGSTPGGTDTDFPLVPNETYTFTMEVVSNGSWEFLVNGNPIPEDGHSAFYKAPTAFAANYAYLGVEVLVGQRAGSLNSSSFLPGQIVIPNAESFRIDGKWLNATNISFLWEFPEWENSQSGSPPGMNLWGIEGNIQNKSIPEGEVVLNDGPYFPYDMPIGTSYDIYPISGNFSVPFANVSKGGSFIDVTKESNGTLLLTPEQENTEVYVIRFQNSSNEIYSEYDMTISSPVYIEDPALDFKAAICAVPINSYSTHWRSLGMYNGPYQEIALAPILPATLTGESIFSLGSVSTSYSGGVYVPVYANSISFLANLGQVYSFDPSLLKFDGTLDVVSSQNISFNYINITHGIIELKATGSFDILSNHNLLFYLVFQPVTEEPLSTEVLLDSSTINGFMINGSALSVITLATGWTNLGPYNISWSSLGGAGTITAVGYSPYNMNILYAASGRGGPWGGQPGGPASGMNGFGGIYRSDNGGETWEPIDLGLNSTAVEAIAVYPQNPDIVVISTTGLNSVVGGYIYKSINGGESWQETYNLGGDSLFYQNGILYAASYHAILYSDNFGTTWKSIGNFSSVVTTAAIANNGSTIYVGLSINNGNYSTEILRSENRGVSYNIVATFPNYLTVSQIVVNPTNNSYVWAVVYQGHTAAPDIFYSSNAGTNWTALNYTAAGIQIPVFTSPEGNIYQNPHTIALDPKNGSIMYIAGHMYVYKSTNGGKSFINMEIYNESLNLGQNNRMISIDPLNDNIIFIGSDAGLIVTYDGGIRWKGLNNISTNELYDVAADGSHIFTTAAGWSPIFSDNYGKTWYQTQVSEEGFVAVDPYNSSIVIHVPPWNNPVYVSNDGGNTFFQSSVNESQLFVQPRDSPNPIAFSPSTIYIMGLAGIFYSNNSGESFTLIPGSINSTYGFGAIAVSPSDPKLVYASNRNGLFVSDDYGFHWKEVNKIKNVFSIAVDPLNSSIVYFVVFNGNTYDMLYKSLNGGISYEYIGMSSSDNFAAPPAIYSYDYLNDTFLVYTSGNGIYVSEDGGNSWLNVSYNLNSLVVSSFFLSNNGSAYLSTYGTGVWYDPDLLNLTFYRNSPILYGYLPDGTNVTVDGTVVSRPGYFSLTLHSGNNSIYWEGESIYLMASSGGIYFYNFSNMQIHLSVSNMNLPTGTQWSVSADGKTYTIKGNVTIALPLGTKGIYVLPVATDYSIYYPSRYYYPINSSLASSVAVHFNENVKASYRNLSSSMNGISWSTQVAYNKGYAIYGGGGDIELLNISTMAIRDIGNPFSDGQVCAISSYSDGFLIGGTVSPIKPGLFFYNISDGSFQNISDYIPSGLEGSFVRVSSVFAINKNSFGFIVGGYEKMFLGMVENGSFLNLSAYIPSSFASSPQFDAYSGAYISSDNSLIISDGTSLGVLYLDNPTFYVLWSFPSSVDIAITSASTPSDVFIASNGNEAMIIGEDQSNGQPYVGIYNPTTGLMDISSIFPQSELFDTVTWSGRDFVLSGVMANGSAPSIFIYNPITETLATVSTSSYGNVNLIDSAILHNSTLLFTSFNSKPVPNTIYVQYFSYYGLITLTPVGTASISTNVPATLSIGNLTYEGQEFSIPEFYGNYSATLSSPGYKKYNFTISMLPFKTSYYNITLVSSRQYNITFNESGLPLGTKWSVNLSNGQSFSSTNSTMIFRELNGTYYYTIATIDKTYSPTQFSGEFIVNGTVVSISISFFKVNYTVTFIENGLQSGTKWSMTLNGTTKTSNTTTIIFNETNGTYSYTISSSNKAYSSNLTSGSITVNGSNVSKSVTFKTTSPGISPAELYAIIGAVVAIAVVVGVIAFIRRR